MFSKKTFLFLFLLFIVIATASSASANDLSDDVVSDIDDDKLEIEQDNDVINEENSNQLSEVSADDADASLGAGVMSFGQLQGQINSVFEGGTLTLNNDYQWDSSFTGDLVVIEKAMTINGNGHVIDARKQTRIFYIPADGVVLNNITFLNGYGDSKGGGLGGCLYLENDLTTINHCSFVNCTAVTAGGAITTSGELRIDDCFFNNNSASEKGGAIRAFYPSTGSKSVTITNSIFGENWAEQGGAIYLDCFTGKGYFTEPAARSYIKNTLFSYNEADYGGAIFNFQYTDIKDSWFVQNYAATGGGAIYMSNGGYFAIGDDSLSQTWALIIHGDSLFSGNYAEDYGGAIRISAGSQALDHGIKGILRVYDTVSFTSNAADQGGALSLVDCDALVENAEFTDNGAYEGSAMYGGVAIRCTFKGNTDPATYDTQVTSKYLGKITAKQSGSYYKDKTITITLTNRVSNAVLANKKVVVKFSNGKTITAKTNSKGVATISVPYAPKTYTATISVSDTGLDVTSAKLTNIKIVKAPTKLAAKKLTAKKGKKKFFKVTVKNKKTKKVIKGVKVKVKVYTGKKSKTYTIKTNAKGVAQLNVKKLKVGIHKVIVSSGDKYCVAKKIKSTIKIKK